MYVRHTVADFKKWKTAFEEHDSFRKQMGSTSSKVYQGAPNPNEVLVITEWKSKADAEKFGNSANLKETMERAGVISEPIIDFAE